jgi:hypothetical protein
METSMRTKAAFVALSMLPMADLHAQSSVTIQGLIDAGASYSATKPEVKIRNSMTVLEFPISSRRDAGRR